MQINSLVKCHACESENNVVLIDFLKFGILKKKLYYHNFPTGKATFYFFYF